MSRWAVVVAAMTTGAVLALAVLAAVTLYLAPPPH